MSRGPAPPTRLRDNSDEDSDESEDGLVGPALPPGYKRGERSSSDSEDSEREVVFKRSKTTHTHTDIEETAKPKDDDADDDDDDDDVDGFFGPALPPGFKKQQSSPERPPVLGPALPPGFRRASDDDDEDSDDSFPGPALPPGYKAETSSSDGEDEEEEVIGPMPAKELVQDSTALDFERRAQKMKDKLTGDDGPEVLARETWMTELPPELQHIGLGARTFKKKSGPKKGDRSGWTETPADKERKIRERLEGKKEAETEKDDTPQMSQKDLKLAEKVSKYNETKRGQSLVSLHTKKMKKKAAETAHVPVERKAFDREADLQVNRFDEAQKQRLLKKSAELNTRFSHSEDRMFL